MKKTWDSSKLIGLSVYATTLHAGAKLQKLSLDQFSFSLAAASLGALTCEGLPPTGNYSDEGTLKMNE